MYAFSALADRSVYVLSLLAWSLLLPTTIAVQQSVLEPSSRTHVDPLRELRGALDVMQSEYYSLWLGKWPAAIDWTAAVMGAHVSSAISTLSHSIKESVEPKVLENEINGYFAQTTAYYFGEDHFSLRNQAYDDMLWVVLGWLESIRFIDLHSTLHYRPDVGLRWHGQQFTPAFAHRARVFYDLAESGWDWELCGGGMTWNPRLLPYKNAITNQLFISASVAMYLHFPGDANDSPFLSAESSTYDPRYLVNAIHGYDWLRNINMTNHHGLYVDGFHIKDFRTNHSKTECDERNEMVYTYNQGVILHGLRGLWEATGNITYLEDGHELISNVVRATCWPEKEHSSPGSSHKWCGLGSRGILTELCDPGAHCSQDSQTFKGIFFHYLTEFCMPLPRTAAVPGRTHGASKELAALHRASCDGYAPWVMHNGEAALKTRDRKGRFGAWWGASLLDGSTGNIEDVDLPLGATDYRNDPSTFSRSTMEETQRSTKVFADTPFHTGGDLNDRGRGRTVETQSGGLAITRAMWEFLIHMRRHEHELR